MFDLMRIILDVLNCGGCCYRITTVLDAAVIQYQPQVASECSRLPADEDIKAGNKSRQL
jgi:hypothetical protein